MMKSAAALRPPFSFFADAEPAYVEQAWLEDRYDLVVSAVVLAFAFLVLGAVLAAAFTA